MRKWFDFPKEKGFSLIKFLKSNESETLVYLNGSYSEGVDRIGMGILDQFKTCSQNNFSKLEEFHKIKKDWLFGYLGYDLKNEIEDLSSNNFDGLGFPDLFLFQPKFVLELHKKIIRIGCYDKDRELLKSINSQFYASISSNLDFKFGKVQNRIDRDTYLQKVERLISHIKKGDVYEVNFCQEFFIEEAIIDPVLLFEELQNRTEAPFSGLINHENLHLLCASPERFVRKTNDRLITQPIKGTARKSSDKFEDEILKRDLYQNKKERSENVMIVDLVRNDLSKSAVQGSVKVDELFGIYSFKTVHQMISTISAQLDPKVSKMDALKGLFPPGSMTGAPKVRAMELIERYETTKRGVYAGSIGYISPDDDFDFNVVIRSFLYNSKNKYLSLITGGAITAYCHPEKEYEESLLKAEALIDCLNSFR